MSRIQSSCIHKTKSWRGFEILNNHKTRRQIGTKTKDSHRIRKQKSFETLNNGKTRRREGFVVVKFAKQEGKDNEHLAKTFIKQKGEEDLKH